MTEDEAKTKWCPFAKAVEVPISINIVSARGEAVSNDRGNILILNCIGSRCMAWRWEYRKSEITKEQAKTPITALCNQRMEKSDNGYCGLAGKK